MSFTRSLAAPGAALVTALAMACSGGATANDAGGSSGAPAENGSSGADTTSSSSSSGAPAVDSGSPDPGPGPTQQCPHTPDAAGFFTLTQGTTTYDARLPASYDPERPYPLLVALKGCYDNAKNFATWAGAPYTLRASQSYIAIAVGGRDGECWKIPADEALVTAAIDHVKTCFHVDQKKVVLAGYDSGAELSFSLGMHDASKFAGVLASKGSLTRGVGASHVDSTLAGAAWKLNVSMSAGIDDEDIPIATMRSDRDKLVAAGFPAELVELDADHNGSTDDFAALIPKMATWVAP